MKKYIAAALALLLTACGSVKGDPVPKKTVTTTETTTVSESVTEASTTPASEETTTTTTTTAETTTTEETTTTAKKKKAKPAAAIDVTPPVFIYCPASVTLSPGSEFDPESLIGYGDNADKSPSLSWSGDVNTYTEGKYDIVLTVTDKSGNSASRAMTVNITNDEPEPDNHIPYSTFEDFAAKYTTKKADVGIDVSAWQGNIDFNAVRDAGCSFVFIRAAHHSDDLYEDENFETNLANAQAAGLDTGIYFYSSCSSAKQAKEQAQWVIDKLGGRKLELPIAFDWESFDKFQSFGMTIDELNECYYAFRDVIEENGYKCVLYSSKDFLDTVWDYDARENVWLAQYDEKADYSGKYKYWQQGLCTINGIVGDVDANVRYLK